MSEANNSESGGNITLNKHPEEYAANSSEHKMPSSGESSSEGSGDSSPESVEQDEEVSPHPVLQRHFTPQVSKRAIKRKLRKLDYNYRKKQRQLNYMYYEISNLGFQEHNQRFCMPFPDCGDPEPGPMYPYDVLLAPGFPMAKFIEWCSKFESDVEVAVDAIYPVTSPNRDIFGTILHILELMVNRMINITTMYLACSIEEIHDISCIRYLTDIVDDSVLEVVIVLKNVANVSAIAALAYKLVVDLRDQFPDYDCQVEIKEYGIDFVFSLPVTIKCYLTTYPSPPELNEGIQGYLMKRSTTICNFHRLSYWKWVEKCPEKLEKLIKLIRLLKDIRSRFEGLQPLDLWNLHLLALWAIENVPTLANFQWTLTMYLHRCLRLLASGLCLQGATGIIGQFADGVLNMSWEDQDLVCRTAQTLLNITCEIGIRPILYGGTGLLKSYKSLETPAVPPNDFGKEETALPTPSCSSEPYISPSLVARINVFLSYLLNIKVTNSLTIDDLLTKQ